ncbi:hypothetical protein GW17_00019827 [Ensete ventricosum]|nr:hypothetical protein GW17_00019827 [Ensete ventricosum]RZR87433.1 hypothetical protein BHM03_00014842 [Ensete ventricosum]
MTALSSPHIPPTFLTFVLDDIDTGSHFMKNKASRNGPVASTKHQVKGTASETDKNEGNKIPNGIRNAIGLVVKSAVTFVSWLSILGLTGFQPVLKKRPPAERQITFSARCVVKERVEVPFESNVSKPNIRYGLRLMLCSKCRLGLVLSMYTWALGDASLMLERCVSSLGRRLVGRDLVNHFVLESTFGPWWSYSTFGVCCDVRGGGETVAYPRLGDLAWVASVGGASLFASAFFHSSTGSLVVDAYTKAVVGGRGLPRSDPSDDQVN